MQKFNLRGSSKTKMCNKARGFGLNVKGPSRIAFARAEATRTACKSFKIEGYSLDDSLNIARQMMDEIPYPNDAIRQLNMQEVETLVTKYYNADHRLAKKGHTKTFTVNGYSLSYCPDFVYSGKTKIVLDGTEKTVPYIEIEQFTTGRQEMISTSRYGSGKLFNSIHHNLDGFGMLLYGMDELRGKNGVVKMSSVALKTDKDKNGDFSNPWSIAEPLKGKKSDNVVSMEVFVKDGEVYEMPFDKGALNLMDNYEASLEEYAKGVDSCPKSTCADCNYYEICHYNHQPVRVDEETIEKTSSNIPSLNEEQQEVVKFREGVAVVCAGAGSGKSQCMSYRIASMIAEGKKPEEFLVVSFSKAAVATILARINYFVNVVFDLEVDVSKIKIATFNSLGMELILKYHEELGFSKEPTLMDSVEQFQLISQCIDWDKQVPGFDYKNHKMNFGAVKGVVPAVVAQVQNIRDKNLSYDDFIAQCSMTDEQKDMIWKVNEQLKDKMLENNLIDYSDQSNLVLKILENIDEDAIGETYDCSTIVIDEFQDSNDFQMLFIKHLVFSNPNFESLMVVGDDAQAIYKFRGATPENILHFEEKMGVKVTDFFLGTNYRSSEEIVQLGAEIISHNVNKIDKPLRSAMGYIGKKPLFKGFESSKGEVAYICSQIEELVKSGVPKNEIAVIAGTSSTLKTISSELSQRGILSQYDMGEKLLDNSRVRAGIGLATFFMESEATKGLMEYLNEFYNNRFFEMEDAQSVIDLEQTMFDYLMEELNLDEKKELFLSLLGALDDGTDAIYSSFLDNIKRKAEYKNLVELLAYIKDYWELGVDDRAEKIGKYDAIALVTAHSSKGKEWSYVFGSVSDFDKGSSISMEELEEKRRLLFVLATRAKIGLTITCLETRKELDESGNHPLNFWYREFKSYDSFDFAS